MPWDAKQYLKYAEERTRPAAELLARVPVEKPHRVVDLGSGPGNSTALLAERWPYAVLHGLDDSPEMLAQARRDYPELTFEQADANRWRPEQPVEVVFANALLQWLPNHAQLVPQLFEGVAEDGALAFQVPCNDDEPSHRLMRELEGPWSPRLEALRDRPRVHTPDFYYDLLAPHARYVDVWQTTYAHVMDDAPAIVEWVKGTGLRPYLAQLEPHERAPYLARYESAIDTAYPPRADGKRLFLFPRLFVVALR